MVISSHHWTQENQEVRLDASLGSPQVVTLFAILFIFLNRAFFNMSEEVEGHEPLGSKHEPLGLSFFLLYPHNAFISLFEQF